MPVVIQWHALGIDRYVDIGEVSQRPRERMSVAGTTIRPRGFLACVVFFG
jgi:hypothetical protein